MEDECEHEWETDDVWNSHTQITTTQRWCALCGLDYEWEYDE